MIVTPRQFAELLIEAVRRQPNCERKVMLFSIDDGTPQGIELEFQGFQTSDKMCVANFHQRTKTIDVKQQKAAEETPVLDRFRSRSSSHL